MDSASGVRNAEPIRPHSPPWCPPPPSPPPRKVGITVDDNLRTSQKSIFAVGDCCSAYKFTHVADFMARMVTRLSTQCGCVGDTFKCVHLFV